MIHLHSEITVTIPVYNIIQCIKKCLDSIKELIFADFELIILVIIQHDYLIRNFKNKTIKFHVDIGLTNKITVGGLATNGFKKQYFFCSKI